MKVLRMLSKFYLITIILLISTCFTTQNSVKTGNELLVLKAFSSIFISNIFLSKFKIRSWRPKFKLYSSGTFASERQQATRWQTKLSGLPTTISLAIPLPPVTWWWLSLLRTHRIFVLLRETSSWRVLLFALWTILQSTQISRRLWVSRWHRISMSISRLQISICKFMWRGNFNFGMLLQSIVRESLYNLFIL